MQYETPGPVGPNEFEPFPVTPLREVVVAGTPEADATSGTGMSSLTAAALLLNPLTNNKVRQAVGSTTQTAVASVVRAWVDHVNTWNKSILGKKGTVQYEAKLHQHAVSLV